jgi:hypothetical protein
MPPERQFQTAAQRRTFFDRKVLHYGYSRTVALGKIIPKEWKYVRIHLIESTPRTLTINIEKLYGELNHAHNKKNDKTDRHNP